MQQGSGGYKQDLFGICATIPIVGRSVSRMRDFLIPFLGITAISYKSVHHLTWLGQEQLIIILYLL